MQSYISCGILILDLVFSQQIFAVDYAFIQPTKLANLNNIQDLKVKGLTNAQQISGEYVQNGQINFFFYDFKSQALTVLQGLSGLTNTGDSLLPFNIVISAGVKWNAKGQATGLVWDPVSYQQQGIVYNYGFVYINGHYELFTGPDTKYFGVVDINDAGQVLGVYSDNPYGLNSSFIYFNGVNAVIPNENARVLHLNNQGEMIGLFRKFDGDPYKVFLYRRGVFTYFDYDSDSALETELGINDQGQAYLFYNSRYSGTLHGILYEHEKITHIDPPFTVVDPVAPAILKFAVNNRGHLIGYIPGYSVSSFVYAQDGYQELAFPGRKDTAVFAINDNGQILGSYGGNSVVEREQFFVGNPLDNFDISSQVLRLNNVEIDGVMRHDVSIALKKYTVLAIGSAVPKDTISDAVSNPVDKWDSATQVLTLNAVLVGKFQYNQVVVKLDAYQVLTKL